MSIYAGWSSNTHHRPPPCDQVCWEHCSGPNGWRYVESVGHCGHWYDGRASIWRWDDKLQRPAPPCDQVCWSQDETAPNSQGWSYRVAGAHCAHRFDKRTQQWSWIVKG